MKRFPAVLANAVLVQRQPALLPIDDSDSKVKFWKKLVDFWYLSSCNAVFVQFFNALASPSW